MKSCIVKRRNNGRVFRDTIYWKDFPHNDFLNRCLDIPYVGYIQALQADFLIYEDINLTVLDEYDVIIYLSNGNDSLGYTPKGSLYVIPCEPIDKLVNEGVDNYFVINNYYNENLPLNHISHPYTYDLESLFKYKTREKQKFIFKQRRSNPIKLPDGFDYQGEGSILQLSYSAWSSDRISYIKKLDLCKYAYSTCMSYSPGQVIAEASILGVITFSTPQKLIAKLILPEFCLINSELDVVDKIKILEADNSLYNSVLTEITDNVKRYLGLESFKRFIEKNEKIHSNDDHQ